MLVHQFTQIQWHIINKVCELLLSYIKIYVTYQFLVSW